MAGTVRHNGHAGRGSIYQRGDGRWCGAVVIPATAYRPAKKKILYGWAPEEVEAKVSDFCAQLEGGAATVESLGDFLSRWYEQAARSNLRPTTLDIYDTTIRLHILPHIGKLLLGELTTLRLQEFYHQLERNGVSERNRKHVHTVLHKAFEQAVTWGILVNNPCKRVIGPKIPRYRPTTVLDADQTKRFLEEASKTRLHAFYVLAVTSGARFGELAALEWSSVNWNNNTISIRKSLSSVRGKLAIGEVKNASSRRLIELPPVAMQALRDHRERMKAEGWNTPYVFVNKRGNWLRKENVQVTSFKPILERAGLPNIRFHDLRHTSSTLLFAQNVHPRIVQERLGHASIDTTLNCYSHVLPTMQKEAAEKVERVLAQ